MVNQTNEQRILQAEIQALIDPLLRTASLRKMAVVGFVFGGDAAPIMIRFGNTKESGPELAALYLKLSDIAEEKETAGQAITTTLTP